MAKFEIFHSVDAEGNSAVSLETAEDAAAACGEYKAGPVRTVCLSVSTELPTADTDEDVVTVVDIQVPPQEEPAKEADDPELPAEGGEKEPAVKTEAEAVAA